MPTKPRTLAEVRALAARMQLHDADRAFAQREEVERLCATVELLVEALWLGLLASLLGLAGGQALAALIAWLLQLDHSLLIGGMVWPVELALVPVVALGVSLAAALLPTLGAYRISVLELLQAR